MKFVDWFWSIEILVISFVSWELFIDSMKYVWWIFSFEVDKIDMVVMKWKLNSRWVVMYLLIVVKIFFDLMEVLLIWVGIWVV